MSFYVHCGIVFGLHLWELKKAWYKEFGMQMCFNDLVSFFSQIIISHDL